MRVVVAGLGVQGQKRRRVAGTDFVAAVDPVNGEAKYRAIEDVPLNSYDAVLACIADEPKIAMFFWSAIFTAALQTVIASSSAAG